MRLIALVSGAVGLTLALATLTACSKGRDLSKPMTWEIAKNPTCGLDAEGVKLTYVSSPKYYELVCHKNVIEHLKAPGTPKTIDVKFYTKGAHYNLCGIHQLAATRKDPNDGFTCVFGPEPHMAGNTCPGNEPACKPNPWDE